MPIQHDAGVRCLSNREFEELDQLVMACAFESQNTLGRLCEEIVYENDMAARLRAAGCHVATQTAVHVAFAGFEKTYRLDLIVNGMLYELKAVELLSNKHESQAYHYAALVGADRVKLLNFGGAKVEGRLLACPFSKLNRFEVEVDRRDWQPVSEDCPDLAKTAEACFKEWGGFLHRQLFKEALLHFHGANVRVPIVRNGLPLGHHPIMRHNKAVGFEVSGLANISAHEKHLGSILNFLPLQAWQWINIRGNRMIVKTIKPRSH